MRPIQFAVGSKMPQSALEICAEILDTGRWSEFDGYGLLPGIKSAAFEIKTPDVIGSKIKVENEGGSSHVEEIIAWDIGRQVALKFQDFSPPLKFLATHFIETWRFRPSDTGTEITREMVMHPKGVMGWLMLMAISRLMEKAFEKHLQQLSRKSISFAR